MTFIEHQCPESRLRGRLYQDFRGVEVKGLLLLKGGV